VYQKVVKKAFLIPLVLVVVVNFIHVYVDSEAICLNVIRPILTQTEANPSMRGDIKELKRVVKKLKEVSNQGSIYSLSSSFLVNDDIIKNVNLPKEFNAVPGMLWCRHVDKRDGFPSEFLMADYLLIADPIQLHLSPDDQQIVEYLAKEVLNGSFTYKFQLEDEFQLDEEVKLKLFKKNKEFDMDDIKRIQSYFKKRYPDYPNLYDFWYEGKK
jgi:hypothetical protein